jgi:hypothetical protein
LYLQFALEREDDWPPFGTESLLFEEIFDGYKCVMVPLFIKGLSVDDIIEIEQGGGGLVTSWRHLRKSGRSTVWLLRLSEEPLINTCLSSLRLLQCNTTALDDFGCYAIDVPSSLPISEVDSLLEILDPARVAIAFPSMRHSE